MKEKPFWKKSFYCGGNENCYPKKCKVCKYESFIEWAQSVAPADSRIERDEIIESFIKNILPYYE